MAGTLGPSDKTLIDNRAFLVAFARELIGAEANSSSQATHAGSDPLALDATSPTSVPVTAPTTTVPPAPVSPAVSLSTP